MSTCHCIGRRGLEIFTTTADERVALGKSRFLETHVPLRMRRFHPAEEWSEDDVLQALMKPYSGGNRVFALYGAAGSGKSELLRWIQLSLEHHCPERTPGIVRLSRTDLGAPALLARLAPLLPVGSNAEGWALRWDEVRRAPVALTNALVWGALGRLLPDDDLCIPAGYALRPLVERAMREALEGDQSSRPFDLVWGEDLRRAADDHPALAMLEEAQVRDALTRAFDAMVLPTPGVSPLLRTAGDWATTQGIRPLLLVDDLVQALPTHAPEVLDWATTLDEGQWDVVIGLTPGSLQTDKRARALVERVSRLDTFDDRMRKLWLSDESGQTCYALPEERAPDLLRAYLEPYRHANSPTCTCMTGQIDSDLWPFTPEIAQRLYRSVPRGKGAPRQLLLAAREVLTHVAAGREPDDVLSTVLPAEAAARHPDARIRRVLEVYGTIRRGRLHVDSSITERLGLGERALTARAEPLQRQEDATDMAPNDHPEPDASVVAIRVWLHGGQPNPQTLHALRLGVARLARIVGGGLGLQGASRAPSLRLTRTGNGTTPAVRIEGIDETDGIRVGRWIGDLAYDIARLSKADARTCNSLMRGIFAHPGSARLVWATLEWESRVRAEVDAALGMSLPEFVAKARRLAGLAWGASSPPLPVLDRDIECLGNQVVGDLSPGTALRDSLEALTADLFCIRTNVWDSIHMEEAIGLKSEMALLQSVVRAPVDRIDITFQAGDQPLRTLLRQLQASLLVVENNIESDNEDLAIARLVQSLESAPLVIQSRLGEVQRGCEVLGSEWSTVGGIILRAQNAIQRIDLDGLASLRRSLLRSVGTDYDGVMPQAPCRRWRRHQILQTHFASDVRDDLLAVDDAVKAATVTRRVLWDDLNEFVASQTCQVKQRIDELLDSTTREGKEEQRIHKRDLDTLIDVARVMKHLSEPLGTLDRLELTMYLSMLQGVRSKWWLRTLRRMARALEKGGSTTIERCYLDIEALLVDNNVGEDHHATIAAVQTLRKYAPDPELWLRRLLAKFLEENNPSLSQIDDRSLRRIRREHPILADIIRIGIVEVPEQEVAYTDSLQVSPG